MRETAHKRRFLRGHTFVRLFVSVTAVSFLILALATFLLSHQFERLSMAEQHRTSVQLLSQARTVFSSIHSWLFPAFIQFSKESSIQRLMHADEHTLVETVQGLKLLNDAGGFYPLLHSIYVYNGTTGQVFSSVMGRERMSELSDPDFFAVLSRYGSGDGPTYFPRRIRLVTESTVPLPAVTASNVFTVVIDDRPSEGNPLKAGMIVNVSEERFRSQFLSTAGANGGDLVIVDRAGTVLSHPDSALFGTRLDSEPYVNRVIAAAEREGTFVEQVGGEPHLVTYVMQRNMGWHFIGLTPYRLVFAPIHRARNVAFLVFGGLTILASVLSFVISRRIYGPIERLFLQAMEAVASQSPQDGDGSVRVSELEIVEEALAATVKRVGELQDNLKRQREMAAHDTLRSYIGGSLSTDEAREALTDVSVSLLSRRLFVAVIRLDRFHTTGADHERVAELLTACGDIVPTDRPAERLAVDMGSDHIALLIAADDEQPSAVDFGELQRTVTDRLGCSVTIGVSEQVSGFDEVPHAYGTALEASEFRFRYGHGSVIRWTELPALPVTAYRFPSETVQQLLTSVKLGKQAEVEATLDDILAGVEPYGHEEFRHVVEVLTYSVQRALLRTEELGHASWGTVRGFREHVHQTETLNELRSVLLETFVEFADRFSTYRSRKRQELIERVKAIVAEHVADPNLNADWIAESVDLSTNYLRSLFRSVDGESLSGFINHARLSRCRDLLANTDLTVKEILTQSGFVSYNYFFELFKREVGMTPVQYREALTSPHAPTSVPVEN